MRTIHGTQAPREGTGRFSMTRNLMGGSWTACVDAIEAAMWRFMDEHSLASYCTMAFFEMSADEALHVNVTHQYRMKRINGWRGPGETAGGFVYNRTFDRTPTTQILRHVRDMVFAAPAVM